MGDPVPSGLDIMREWFELSDKLGKELEESISRIENFIRIKDRARTRRTSAHC